MLGLLLPARRHLVVAAVLATTVLGAALGQVSRSDAGTPGPARAALPTVRHHVAHRVVWDEWKSGRKGIHLRSATVDGSDERRVYDLPAGFTMELTLDPLGHRAAFATCCRDSLPPMVVVPVKGGAALEPLRRHPEIYFVGGIGWSRDGRRLAFEGTVQRPHRVVTSLWTIRPDGTGLRHVLTFPHTDQPVINDALAWTRAGILYSDGTDLRAARAGASHVLMRHVSSVRISGDGHHIVTERYVDGQWAIWLGRANGTHQHRVYVNPESHRVDYYGVTPNYRGRKLIAARSRSSVTRSINDVVTWHADDEPSTATALDFARHADALTWN